MHCRQLDELSNAIRKIRPELTNREGVVFRRDNARPHTSLETRQKLLQLRWDSSTLFIRRCIFDWPFATKTRTNSVGKMAKSNGFKLIRYVVEQSCLMWKSFVLFVEKKPHGLIGQLDTNISAELIKKLVQICEIPLSLVSLVKNSRKFAAENSSMKSIWNFVVKLTTSSLLREPRACKFWHYWLFCIFQPFIFKILSSVINFVTLLRARSFSFHFIVSITSYIRKLRSARSFLTVFTILARRIMAF